MSALAQFSTNGASRLTQPRRLSLDVSPDHPAAEGAYIGNVVFGCGGNSVTLNIINRLCHALGERMGAFDSDITVLKEIASEILALHLSCNGDFAGVLDHKANYPYLAAGGAPEFLTAWQTSQGLGMMRIGGAVVTGYHLDEIMVVIRRVLQRALMALGGRMQKRLNVHAVFSPGGATGSSTSGMIMRIARQQARSISSTLQVALIAHCISPLCFDDVLATPAMRRRNLANAEQCFVEHEQLQDADWADSLDELLGSSALRSPTADSYVYYAAIDESGCVRTKDEAREAIAANILASENQALEAKDAAYEANARPAYKGGNGAAGSEAVVCTMASHIAQAPIDKLSTIAAVKETQRQIDALREESSDARIRSLAQSRLATLELDQTQQEIKKRLQPEDHVPMFNKGMNSAVMLALLARADVRWESQGRPQLQRRDAKLEGEMRRHAEQSMESYLSEVYAAGETLSEVEGALKAALQVIEKRRQEVSERLEILARADQRAQYEKLRRTVEGGGWRGKRARYAMRRALEEVIEADVRAKALKTYRHAVLDPMARRLKAEAAACEQLDDVLKVHSQQIESQAQQLLEEIGRRARYVVEAVSAEEAPRIVDRLHREVPQKLGPHPQISLGGLLAADEPDALSRIIDHTAEQIRSRNIAFIKQTCKDIGSFCTHFGCAFRVEHWIASHVAVVLPAKLNVSIHGPGNVPVTTYGVGPESLRETFEAAAAADRNCRGFQFVASNETPYQLIVRAKQARVTFEGIPDRQETRRNHQAFLQTASPTDAWGVLYSHQRFAEAQSLRAK